MALRAKASYLRTNLKWSLEIGGHYLETSKEEWVNYQNHKGEGRTLCNHSIALMVFVVYPLFLGGLYLLYMVRKKKIFKLFLRKYEKLYANDEKDDIIVKEVLDCSPQWNYSSSIWIDNNEVKNSSFLSSATLEKKYTRNSTITIANN